MSLTSYMDCDNIRTEGVLICFICGSPNRIILYKNLHDRWFGTLGQWTLKRCANCGLAYLDPRPTAESVGKTYANYYTHQTQLNAVQTNSLLRKKSLKVLFRCIYHLLNIPVYRMQRKLDEMHLGRVLPGRLLDIGCGDGRFLKRMHDLGWTVQGVEVDPLSAKFAAETFGLSVHAGTVESAMFPDNYFDAVTMSHVIEHVYDPIALLSECRRILRPAGLLVVATPNIESMGHKYFGRMWRDLDPPRHLHLFSLKTMGIVLRRAGFIHSAINTSAAHADIISIGSMQIKKQAIYDETQLPKVRWRLFGLIFLLCEWLFICFRTELGEELIMKVKK